MEYTGEEIHEAFIFNFYEAMEEYKHIYNNIADLQNTMYETVNIKNFDLGSPVNRKRYMDLCQNFTTVSEFEQKRFKIVTTKVLKHIGIEQPLQYLKEPMDYFEFVSMMYLDKKRIINGYGEKEFYDIVNQMYMDNFINIMKDR